MTHTTKHETMEEVKCRLGVNSKTHCTM